MRAVRYEDLQVGQHVIMTRADKKWPGLAHLLFRVLAVDDPYLVLATGTHPATTTHMILGREAEFAEPSKELLAAIAPETFALDAEYIG